MDRGGPVDEASDARHPAGPRPRDAVPRSAVTTVGIEEAARLVGTSPSTIRAWERQGLVSPLRTRGGARRYRPRDIERLRSVRAWRSVDGLNAPAIRRLLADDPSGAPDPETGLDSTGASAPAWAIGAQPIGGRLREVRRERGLSLRAAAAASGLSPSFLSALERDESGINFGRLHQLLDAYGTTMAELLADHEPPTRLVASSARHAVVAGGIRIEDLARGSRLLEPQLFVLAPGASSNGSYSHPGEEFMYVLRGSIAVWLGDAQEGYHLGPGDSLTFPSTLSHRFEALGPDDTRLIWVNTPPTF